MLFRQVTHDDLGCASYLIGDEDAGVAAVVDPKLHIEEYLRLARYLGVRKNLFDLRRAAAIQNLEALHYIHREAA